MLRRARPLAVFLFSATALLPAQNEVVFVGTSVGGSTDPHYFASSSSGTVLANAGIADTDNVTDAAWMDQGQNLYCSKSLGTGITRAQWNGQSATWSTFYNAPGSCYGLGADRYRKRLWTLTGPSASSRELVCLDADPGSATYGQVLAQTNTLSGVARERWGLSPWGSLAVVPHAFLQNGGLVEIVVTAAGHPSFGQVVQSASLPNATGALTAAFGCGISGDDLFAFVAYGGIGNQGLAVMFIATGTFIDFDPATPGQQDLPLPMLPNGIGMSAYGYSLVVSGGNTAMRIDVDPWTPQNTTMTPLTSAGVLTNCYGASVTADGRKAAVTATNPPSLILFDLRSGALLHNIALPGASNIYTTAWQDLRPDASATAYGSGCSGSLGVPVLSASFPPRLGTGYALDVSNVPQRLAVFVAGSSDSMSGSLPLPLSLAAQGMPGCSLLAEIALAELRIASVTTASWQFSIPTNPLLFGYTFYAQAFVFDPPANALGFVVSNGVRSRVGL